MIYLSKKSILRINFRTVEAHGGNFMQPHNLLNEHSLDYLVETVKSEMFGQQLYPRISDKAGLYLFNIISNHVFSDGNKRTGLESALFFLEINGYLLEQINDKDLEQFILQVASGKVSLIECQKWFELNIMKN